MQTSPIHEDICTFTIMGIWPTVLVNVPARLPSINHSNVAESFALYVEARSLHYSKTAHIITNSNTHIVLFMHVHTQHIHTHTRTRTHTHTRMHTYTHTHTSEGYSLTDLQYTLASEIVGYPTSAPYNENGK